MSEKSGFEAATEELFAGSPAVFVARRDALARQARASGDRVLAAEISALRRPTLGAWYLNLAARGGLASLQQWLLLGQQLRQATVDGRAAALRELAAQRHPLETRLLKELTEYLSKLEITATPAGLDEVRGTLAAALADPAAEALVASGRVERPLAYAGFGPLGLTVSPASAVNGHLDQADASVAGTGNEAAALRARELERAREELRAAEADFADLTSRREAVEAQADAARERIDALTAELAEAQVTLAAVTEQSAELGTAQDAGRLRVERARAVFESA